jgi:serine protease
VIGNLLTRRLVAAALIWGALAIAGALGAAAAARAASYVPGEVVVGYTQSPGLMMAGDVAGAAGVRPPGPPAPVSEQVIRLPRGETVAQAIARLRHEPGVAYAVPDFIAHAAGAWFPNDPGRSHRIGGWESMQWNLMPAAGVDAPDAWGNLIADGRPGGDGVKVAVLDTGVAYRDWRQFKESPDFLGTRFVDPYDFLANNRFPLDREGHGTFVAGEIAESTNNGVGLTGLAYGASIMPLRVLDADGTGDASTIARGIRYAASHGAQVINLSLEFDPGTTAGDIPDIIDAIRFAHRHGSVVVAAAGNEGLQQVAYPARAPAVISVGSTTSDRCLAYYSNGGPNLDLVAPGGGGDALLPTDPDCHPGRNLPSIYQMTFFDSSNPNRFGYPGGIFGTSMSAPEVAAAAALVIASGVIGRHPSPDAVLARLEQTATPLGGPKPNPEFGYGLLNAGAATAPIAPAATSRR